MKKISRQRLRDALTAAELISLQVAGHTYDQFASDIWFRGATERQLEIIGEALNQIRRDDAVLAPLIPSIHEWIAMRNVIAHQYDRIDIRIVWDAVTLDDELPKLISTLRVLLIP